VNVDQLFDVVMRAGIWRAMQGVSPIAAAGIAAACVVAALVARRWRRR